MRPARGVAAVGSSVTYLSVRSFVADDRALRSSHLSPRGPASDLALTTAERAGIPIQFPQAEAEPVRLTA
jgi:hypothetical protein